MVRKVAILLAVIAIAECVLAQSNEEIPSIYGMQQLSIIADTSAKLDLVLPYEGEAGFDFLRIPAKRREPIQVYVTADKVDQFKAFLSENEIEFEVVVHDVLKLLHNERVSQKRLRRSLRDAPLRNSSENKLFLRYDTYKHYMEKLASMYPNFIELVVLGKSFEQRDIVGLKFTSTKFSRFGWENPAVFVDAGIHAREWLAPVTAFYFMLQLVKPENRHLFQHVDIHIVPVLNPDGYEFSHTGGIKNRLWRKTRSYIPFTRDQCIGADGNRNFDIDWNRMRSSKDCSADNFAGVRAFSEPETRSLRDYLYARRSNIKVYLSLHSFGSYLLYPYGFTNKLTPRNEYSLKCTAEQAARALKNVRGTEYKVGSSGKLLYEASGGSDDWAMAVAGIDLAYTMELPGQGSIIERFNPPSSEIVPVGQESFQALKVFISYAKGEICQEVAGSSSFVFPQ